MAKTAPKQVELFTPQGELAHFDADSAENLITMGYTPVTPESLAHYKVVKQNSGVGSTLRANVEALGRGLSGGLTDVAESKLGLATPEELQAREEGSPSSTAVSKFIGQGALLAGGTALAAAAAPAAVGAGIGAALFGGVVGGGLAGAASGGTEEFSREVLGPAPLVGEQIAQHALSGGVSGVLSGVLGAFGGAALGRVLKGAGGLAGFAERQAVRSTGATATAVGKLEEQGLLNKVGRHILDEGYYGKGLANFGSSAVEARTAALATKEASGKFIGDTLASAGTKVEVGALANSLEQLGSVGKWDIFPQGFKASLRDAAAKLGAGTGPSNALAVEELQVIKQKIAEQVSSMGGRNAPAELLEAQKLVRQAIDSAIPANASAAFMAAKQKFGLASEAAKLFKGAANKELANPGAGFRSMVADPGAAMIATANPTAAAAYLGGKFASRASRFGNVARAADWLSSTSVVQGIARQSNKAWVQAVDDIIAGATGTTIRAVMDPGDYDSVARGVEQANLHPEELTGAIHAAIGQDVSADHPEAATHASLAAQQAFAYLEQHRPKAPFAPTPYDGDYTPPDYLKAQWLDMVRGVTNPASVLAHPTRDSLAALKAVYPETYAANVLSVQEALAKRGGKALPYQSKLLLNTFLGTPVSTLADTHLGQQMQAIYAQAGQGQGQDNGQKGSARNGAARTMRIKQIAQDEATTVDHMRSADGIS